MTVRAFSFGGGVQSTAALILAAQRKIDFPLFLFANVGENAENPDTLRYIESYAQPYAADNGLDLVTVRRQWKDGRGWTLYDLLVNPESCSIGIPVRMAGSGAPGTRACTETFKIDVIAAYLRTQCGARKDAKALVGLGISMDEWRRMKTSSGVPVYDICYPLIDLRLDRASCMQIIRDAGLPVPPKSSCYFCPFHTLGAWREMKRTRPDLFEKAVELEQILIERRTKLGRDPVYLTDKDVTLDRAVGNGVQPRLLEDEDEGCETGYCMT